MMMMILFWKHIQFPEAEYGFALTLAIGPGGVYFSDYTDNTRVDQLDTN